MDWNPWWCEKGYTRYFHLSAFIFLLLGILLTKQKMKMRVESIPEFCHILKFWFLDQFFSFVNDYKVTSKFWENKASISKEVFSVCRKS